jgi:diguanylate cyclase (GGDEF)-like protein/PAS domain S-box-containing protein
MGIITTEETFSIGGRSARMELEGGFYKNLLDNLYDGVYFLDTERRITYWNQGAKRLTGYDSAEVVGCYCREDILEHVDDKGTQLCETSLCPAAKTLKDGRARYEDLYLHHKSGYRVPVSIRVAPIKNPQGMVIGAVEVFSDNTPRVVSRQTIEELQKIALLDPLTEVGNRRYAEMNLRFRLAQLERYDWPFGVLFMDLDDFKSINDAYGHKVGDDVLKMTARTLSNSLRSFDVVSRWGGEEFLAVIVNIDASGLSVVSEKLRVMVERSRITFDSRNIRTTVSIGGTLAHASDNEETLIERADELMYASKAEGRNRATIG